MFLKKSILSIIFILLFSILFNLGTTNQTIAAIGDSCPEGIKSGEACVDGDENEGYCYYGKCIEIFFDKSTGDRCDDSSLPEGTPCSDGSLCYEGFCKKTCMEIKTFAQLCNKNNPNEGRCYPRDNENYENGITQICVINSNQVPKEGLYCGGPDTWGVCKSECKEGYTSALLGDPNHPGFNCGGTEFSCCARDDDFLCPFLKYGDECPGDKGYCYNGVCEKEVGKIAGDLCGSRGGKCEIGSLTCSGDRHRDLSGDGRSCDSGLICCIDNEKLAPGVCDNKKNGEECGYKGYCYDGECSDFGDAKLDEKCGENNNGKCVEIKSGYATKRCSELGLSYVTRGRPCSKDPALPFPLICCAPSGSSNSSDSITPNPIDRTKFNRDYQTCEEINQAQPDEGGSGGLGIFQRSIVPCGRSCDYKSTSDLNEMDECTLCHFIIMGKNIYDLILALIVIVSLLMIAAGGILYMISGSNPSTNSMAKEIIKKTLIGFTLFLTSWIIVNTILMIISTRPGSMLGSGGTWFKFTCDTKSDFQQNYNNLNLP